MCETTSDFVEDAPSRSNWLRIPVACYPIRDQAGFCFSSSPSMVNEGGINFHQGVTRRKRSWAVFLSWQIVRPFGAFQRCVSDSFFILARTHTDSRTKNSMLLRACDNQASDDKFQIRNLPFSLSLSLFSFYAVCVLASPCAQSIRWNWPQISLYRIPIWHAKKERIRKPVGNFGDSWLI